ncbi:hypothetical protein N7495_005356 [Penicillium taxi]|uniref:uncharacterized protein n=1 Tax=Penicillium taxi TaxID=168475 RepID=UPI002545BACE|nr:uncharacterized protein N7495_005356 [Penicillium taxi]KAJ5893665.1 hypothetical protein N7495_005356 [Penicillium taxi]
MVMPIQTRIPTMALTKPTLAGAVASTEPAMPNFSWSGSECSLRSLSTLSNPSAPPPTPTDSLYDINPRKSSFSSEYGMGAACAFPSWPTRLSLSSTDPSESFVNNAFLSDEDLLWMPENSACDTLLEEPEPEFPTSMNVEQQVQRARAVAAAEEQDRARFMAKVNAHAIAYQALRHGKSPKNTVSVSVNERERIVPTAKRNKKRPVLGAKRRAQSSSKVPTV